MSALKVLYVGGTGTISWSCVRRSVEVGHRVTVLNRGLTASRRPLPDSVQWLEADLTDVGEVGETLGAREFDATVNFLSFSAREVEQSIALFGARSSHYLHISTAAMYQKPPRRVPYLESTARHSPGSSYASEKIAAEDVLLAAYAEHGLPATIVRPSHTYDDRKPPLPGDWTVVERIARGEEIVVPGDGTSLWTVTHAEDFAVGLNGLLANPQTFGEAFHITSEFVYDWNQIYRIVAAALGTEARIVHVPSDFLGVGARLALDRAHRARPQVQRRARQLEDPRLRALLRPEDLLPRRSSPIRRLASRASRGGCGRSRRRCHLQPAGEGLPRGVRALPRPRALRRRSRPQIETGARRSRQETA